MPEIVFSEEAMKSLKIIRDHLSKKHGRVLSQVEALEMAADAWLDENDPKRKSKSAEDLSSRTNPLKNRPE